MFALALRLLPADFGTDAAVARGKKESPASQRDANLQAAVDLRHALQRAREIISMIGV